MRRDLLISSLLVLVIGTIFSPALTADFVQWDDDINIYKNPHIQQLNAENLRWMFTDCAYTPRYRPLNWLTWAVLWKVSGGKAGLFHVATLALHAANAVLIFLLLKKILARVEPNSDVRSASRAAWCAALGALPWAVHPLRVEAVSWVNCQTYTQSLFFLLLSLWFYLRAAELGSTPAPSLLGSRLFCFSVLSFALAMLTYPTGIGFVVILLVVDYFLFQSRPLKSVLLEKVPFVLITMLLASVAWTARSNLHGFWATEYQTGALPILSRISQAFYIWAYYLWKPWWPTHLSPTYLRLVSFQPAEPIFLFSAALIIGASIFLLQQLRRWPMLFALWICHLALLIPMLGFTEHPHYANDRYSYIQGVTWAVLLAFAFCKLAQRWKPLAFASGVIVIAALSGLSFQQSRIWTNTDVLFNSIIVRLGDDPHRANFYWRLGNYHLSQKKVSQAVVDFTEALKINPAFVEARNNLAGIYLSEGKVDDAIAQYSIILGRDPINALAHYNLGTILRDQGKMEEALSHFRAALAHDPNNAEAHNDLGIALFALGKPEEALEHIFAAVRLQPNSPKTQFVCGTAMLQQQKFPEAIEHLSLAVQLKPDFPEAHSNLGNALAMMNRVSDALPHFSRATELKPDLPESYLPLAMALMQVGKSGEAKRAFQQGIRLAEATGKRELATRMISQLQSLDAQPEPKAAR